MSRAGSTEEVNDGIGLRGASSVYGTQRIECAAGSAGNAGGRGHGRGQRQARDGDGV